MNIVHKATQLSQSFFGNFFNSVRHSHFSSYKNCLQIKSILTETHRTNLALSHMDHQIAFLQPAKIFWHIPDRKIHQSPSSLVPRTPDLIYFPDVLRWMKTKIMFKYLRRAWDPSFTEGAFIYGSTQAICRITEIINSNNVSEFEGLLTIPARIKLIEDMTKKLTKTQREIIRIYPRDIKILVPMTVGLNRRGSEKQCKITMRVLALKWFPQRSGYMRLVLVALQSEFSKDYTNGIDEDWNISGFDVMECTVLAQAPTNTH